MTTYRDNAAAFVVATADTTKFRAWIAGFEAMLSGSGWTQASDATGQISSTTVTWPGSANTIAGYQIWYLDDALHATYPIYVRFGFGQGASYARLILNFQVGYATSGAGALTGWTSSTQTLIDGSTAASNPVAATGINFGSSGEGYAWFVHGRGNFGTYSPTFCLQREYNPADGSIKNNGNWSIVANQVTASTQGYSVVRATATVTTWQADTCMVPQGATVSAKAHELELYRHYVRYPHVSAVGDMCTYLAAEVQTDSTFIADICGNNRTFIATGVTGWSGRALAGHSCAAIWE